MIEILVLVLSIFSQTNPEHFLTLDSIKIGIKNYKNETREECSSLLTNLNTCLIETIKQRPPDFDFTPEIEYELRLFINNLWKENNNNQQNRLNKNKFDTSLDIENEAIQEKANIEIDKFIKKIRRFVAKSKYEGFKPKRQENKSVKFSNDNELLEEATLILELYLNSEPIYSELIDKREGRGKNAPMGELYLFRAEVYFRRKRYQKSIDELMKSISCNNLAFDTFYLLGKAYFEKGELLDSEDTDKKDCYEKAEFYYKKAINRSTETSNIEIYKDCSVVENKLGKKTESEKSLKTYSDFKKQ